MKDFFDIHCHILPYVDDGATDMNMAIKMLQIEYRDGVRNIIVTPHYRKGVFETRIAEIQDIYNEVKTIADSIGINLYLGCEYHVNMDMIEDLKLGERPTMAGSRCVLCEFSSTDDASYIKERTYTLVRHGYTPILAHIERYTSMIRNISLIEQLASLGCQMQVDAGSILGEEGFSKKRFCRRLLDYGFVHMVGSDAHNLGRRRPNIGKCAIYLEKKYGLRYTEQILCWNPEKILLK